MSNEGRLSRKFITLEESFVDNRRDTREQLEKLEEDTREQIKKLGAGIAELRNALHGISGASSHNTAMVNVGNDNRVRRDNPTKRLKLSTIASLDLKRTDLTAVSGTEGSTNAPDHLLCLVNQLKERVKCLEEKHDDGDDMKGIFTADMKCLDSKHWELPQGTILKGQALSDQVIAQGKLMTKFFAILQSLRKSKQGRDGFLRIQAIIESIQKDVSGLKNTTNNNGCSGAGRSTTPNPTQPIAQLDTTERDKSIEELKANISAVDEKFKTQIALLNGNIIPPNLEDLQTKVDSMHEKLIKTEALFTEKLKSFQNGEFKKIVDACREDGRIGKSTADSARAVNELKLELNGTRQILRRVQMSFAEGIKMRMDAITAVLRHELEVTLTSPLGFGPEKQHTCAQAFRLLKLTTQGTACSLLEFRELLRYFLIRANGKCVILRKSDMDREDATALSFTLATFAHICALILLPIEKRKQLAISQRRAPDGSLFFTRIIGNQFLKKSTTGANTERFIFCGKGKFSTGSRDQQAVNTFPDTVVLWQPSLQSNKNTFNTPITSRRLTSDDTFYRSTINSGLKYKFQFTWTRRPDLAYIPHMPVDSILGDVSIVMPAVDIATAKLATEIDIALRDGEIHRDVSECSF